MIRPLVCVCWLGAVLAAQQPQTFLVDAANGPGAQFTDITAAAAAVPDGSILRVRGGAYGAVLVQGKGLTILCDPGVIAGSAGSFLAVLDTQPSQPVVIRGLVPSAANLYFMVRNAVGPVVLDGAGAAMVLNRQAIFPPAIVVSSQVVLQRWAVTSAIGFQVFQSSVAFEQCDLVGGDAILALEVGWMPGTPGLTAVDSDVQLVHSSVRGGNGIVYVFVRPAAAAVSLGGTSRLRVVGQAAHSLTGGNTPAVGAQSAILGDGVARVDPLVTMSGNPAVGSGIVLTRPQMPSLVSYGAGPGGTLLAHRHGAAGSVFAVALGLPGPIVHLPGVLDPLWFDPSRYCIEAVGIGSTAGPFVIQRPVPNQAGLVGVNLVWQAADLHATGVIELSNPSPTVIR